MDRTWKKYVRPGLRDQEVLDLHDYNDFHWNRNSLFESLHAEIISGRYAPNSSLPVRIEKKLGVTRTLVLPVPEDAVVLQCIVESILPTVIKKQPSSNSFFSRSHGFEKPDFKYHKDYIWFRRWVEFSKVRHNVVSTHDFIITTDIANYFDNIKYSHLRSILSALGQIDEVTLDILFHILDGIGWKPDYLPPPKQGLPQVNFDAPRLLSHAYLFEADELLKSRSANAFVRWVDDITVAVDTKADAKHLLRDLDQLLMTRGLRLNSGKTQVLSAKEAAVFFHSKENDYLNDEKERFGKYKNNPYRLQQLRVRLRKRFSGFISKPATGHWDKVVKRYIGLFALLKDTAALSYCRVIFISEPPLRETIIRYFSSIGASRAVLKTTSQFLLGDHALDDSSVFRIAHMLTEWEVKPNSQMHRDIRELGISISVNSYTEKNPFYFLASLWILSKYGLRKHVTDLLNGHTKLWSTSEFLCRQVAAIQPKFRHHSEGKRIRKIIEKHRFRSANAVLASLDEIASKAPTIDSAVRLYILNGNNKGTYSLQRFLLCLHVLSCKSVPSKTKHSLKMDIAKIMTDPLYLKVIQKLK